MLRDLRLDLQLLIDDLHILRVHLQFLVLHLRLFQLPSQIFHFPSSFLHLSFHRFQLFFLVSYILLQLLDLFAAIVELVFQLHYLLLRLALHPLKLLRQISDFRVLLNQAQLQILTLKDVLLHFLLILISLALQRFVCNR